MKMSIEAYVGSLDAWLPSCQPSPVKHSRRTESPFAVVANSPRRRASSEPVPIPRTPQSGWPGRLSLTVETNQREALGQPTQDDDLLRDIPARCAAFEQYDQQHGRCHDMEATVRRGRRRLPVGGVQHDHDSALATAASLPMLAAQAPVSLASLCKALSTPATHTTLATAKNAAASDAEAAALSTSTADVTAAFTRSMTWSTELLPPSPTAAGSGLGFSGLSCVGVSDVHALEGVPEQATTFTLPPLEMRRLSSVGGVPSTVAPRTSVGAVRCSTRRGLYEGTVRCGSPRNTWQYCPVAVQARAPR